MSKRNLRDWLTAYLEYTNETESPESYHTWSGLSLIAGVLQRKVYFKWGFETLYPNLYVILVGPSGKARKGVALGIAKDLLVSVPGVSVSPEAASPEGVILAMKRASTQFNDPTTNKIRFHCSLTAFSEELAVFLGQANIGLLSKLTDWYDSKDDWSYETISRGRDALQGVCFNLLGATAPDWIQSMLPTEAVGGGFTSRCIFVVEENKGKIVPKPEMTDRTKLLQDSLVKDLEQINQMAGLFTYSPDADEAYQVWYVSQEENHAKGKFEINDPKFAGYCDRRATHIRKIGMLLSASRSDSMMVELEDFQRALTVLQRTELKMHMAFRGLGTSKIASITGKVMDYIRTVRITTTKVLMQMFWRDLGPDELKQVEDSLEAMQYIKIKLNVSNGDKTYIWIGDEK